MILFLLYIYLFMFFLWFIWFVFDILEIFVVDREICLFSFFFILLLNFLILIIKFWLGWCLIRGNLIGWKICWVIVCWCCWIVNWVELEVCCDISFLVYVELYKLMIKLEIVFVYGSDDYVCLLKNLDDCMGFCYF